MTRELAAPEMSQAALEFMQTIGPPPWQVSTRELAAELGVGQATANRAIHRLLDEGLIELVRPGRSGGYPATYRPTTLAGALPPIDRLTARRLLACGFGAPHE